MERMLRLMLLCVVAILPFGTMADGLVTPPEGVPQEAWKMKYDKFKYVQNEQWTAKDTCRDVKVVLTEDQIYVKGVFREFPEAWIKGSRTGRLFDFEQNQIIGEKEGKPVYFQKGKADIEKSYEFPYINPILFIKYAAPYEFSESGLAAFVCTDYPWRYHDNSFWYTENQGDSLSFPADIPSGVSGADMDIPEVEFPVNVRFYKTELLVPPQGLAEETWEMTADDYRILLPTDEGVENNRYRRDVRFIRDGDILYIKGIFREYPDSWIKAVIGKKGKVEFQPDQFLGYDPDGMPMFFISGKAFYSVESGNTFSSYGVNFYGPEYYDFRMSGPDNSIISYDGEAKISGSAFWYARNSRSSVRFYSGYRDGDGFYGTGFPDLDYYMVYIRFENKNASVSPVIGDPNETPAPVYDLYGRRMPSDGLRPGIYIRAGKKFVVK